MPANCKVLTTGGPLFTKKDGNWVQIALVSWGPNAADMTDTSYDVNADVLYYKDWITTHKDRLEPLSLQVFNFQLFTVQLI